MMFVDVPLGAIVLLYVGPPAPWGIWVERMPWEWVRNLSQATGVAFPDLDADEVYLACRNADSSVSVMAVVSTAPMSGFAAPPDIRPKVAHGYFIGEN